MVYSLTAFRFLLKCHPVQKSSLTNLNETTYNSTPHHSLTSYLLFIYNSYHDIYIKYTMCILHISINKIISYILYIFGASLFMCISFISPVEHELHESGEFFCFHCCISSFNNRSWLRADNQKLLDKLIINFSSFTLTLSYSVLYSFLKKGEFFISDLSTLIVRWQRCRIKDEIPP